MNTKLSQVPVIDRTADIRASRLGAFTEVGARTRFLEVEFGDYSYVAHDGDIAYATIGKFCSIAAVTRINPGNHPMQRVSQSHFTYRASLYFAGEVDEAEFFDWRRSHAVTFGHDVWVGHGAIVLPGRNVGIGAVVAANAVVTKDVPDFAIFAGNPARIVRMRFSDEISQRLKRLAWWDWPHEALHAALNDFRKLPAEAFLDKYETMSAVA